MSNKNYEAVLREANDYFSSQGLQIIGEGYKEIAQDKGLFAQYVDQLLEGVDNPTQRAEMAQLMINNNVHTLTESYAGISPIASFSGPTIRKLWPKFAVKEALPTEVAAVPRISKVFQKPVIIKPDGTKKYLPFGVDTYADEYTGKEYLTRLAKFQEAGVAELNYVTAAGTGETGTLTVANTASRLAVQPLDSDIRVAKIVLKNGAVKEATNGDVTLHDIELDIPAHRLDIMNSFELTVPYPQTYKVVSQEVVKDKEAGTLTIIGRADLINGKVKLAVFGGPDIADGITVTVRGAMSSEFNEVHDSVSIEMGRFDIDLPTGQHLVAEVPVEMIQDLQAMYNIDGTQELINTMTDVFSLRLDKEALAFLHNAAAGNTHPEFAHLTDNVLDLEEPRYHLNFDARPAAGFTAGPKAWREQLKPLVDHLAQRIKNATFLKAGYFVILANPIDAAILDNINWTQRDGERTVNGVEVDYKVGFYTGVNDYKVVQSQTVNPGTMYMLFVPTGASNQMTIKYFPYQYTTVIDKYASANRSRVPAIMMTKRHTFHEFLPALGTINIINNDGNPHNAFGNYWANGNTGGAAWGAKKE